MEICRHAVHHGLVKRAVQDEVVDQRACGRAPVRGVGREPGAIRRCLELLHASIEGEVRLDDLASEVGLSKPYLVRAFKREVGRPPCEYLMHLRVARARALLAGGTLATDVAAACGFCDQSHLNRWFKRVHGMTPGQYVRALPQSATRANGAPADPRAQEGGLNAAASRFAGAVR